MLYSSHIVYNDVFYDMEEKTKRISGTHSFNCSIIEISVGVHAGLG